LVICMITPVVVPVICDRMNFPDYLTAGIFDSMKNRVFISILFFDLTGILRKLLIRVSYFKIPGAECK